MEELLVSRLLTTPKISRANMIQIEGFSPRGDEKWDFWVAPKRAEFAAKTSMGEAKSLGYLVPSVMLDPKALVFQGIRSDGHAEGLCYVGFPTHRFGPTGQEIRPKDLECFLVFVNEERIIYTWRWELSANEKLEEGFTDRFGRRIR